MHLREEAVCSQAVCDHQHQPGSRGCQRRRVGRHAVNQRGGEVDVKDGEEEDHMDRQSNQEEGNHPHVGHQR